MTNYVVFFLNDGDVVKEGLFLADCEEMARVQAEEWADFYYNGYIIQLDEEC